MRKISERGIWETLIINANINDNYKYEITSFGRTFLKQDPYAFYSETQGKTSSKVFNIVPSRSNIHNLIIRYLFPEAF